MCFPPVTGVQKEDSLTLSSVGISFINNPRVVEVVEVVVGARVVLGSAGFGLTVYIKPASKASCSFRQVNTVFAFPSES